MNGQLIHELVARLIAHGTPAEVAAAVIVEAFTAGANGARAEASQPVESSGARRTRRWRERHKASKNVTPEQPSPSVTVTSQASQSVTSDKTPLTYLLTDSEIQESKKEKKVRARKAPASPMPVDWQVKPAHYDAASKLQIPRQSVLDKAEDMRLWAQSSGSVKADWDATFHGFLRRDAQKLGGSRGQPPPRGRPKTAIELELEQDLAGRDHEPATFDDQPFLDLAAEPSAAR